jgi:nucleotide exchange factor SIL1
MLHALLACLIGLSAFTHVLSASTQDASHPADTDIICSPTNATDCYGRTFQPTEEFQLIREGQEIPPGLHVRLNVYTGEKEARLNIPTEEDERLAGLPIESSVVVVDQAANNVADERPAMRDRHPEQPPAYDAAGKVVPPKPSDDGAVGDAGNFREAVNLLENKVVTDEELDVALSHLLELAHDIFYGVELVKRSVSLKALTWLLFSESPSQRREAASILGGALQNNPTALREALGAWSTTPSNGTLIEVVLQTLEWENDSTAARAKVSVLAGLVKDVESRDAFLEKGGMRQLLASFMTEGQQWDNTRRKIAQFVMDTFLNEDMGAHLGVWPKDSQDVATDAACSSVHDLPESCWRYQIEKISTGRDTPEWAVEFERLLKLAAPSWWAKTSVPKMHDEL